MSFVIVALINGLVHAIVAEDLLDVCIADEVLPALQFQKVEIDSSVQKVREVAGEDKIVAFIGRRVRDFGEACLEHVLLAETDLIHASYEGLDVLSSYLVELGSELLDKSVVQTRLHPSVRGILLHDEGNLRC